MVLNRKQKQQRKHRSGTKRFASGCGVRKSKRQGVMQNGGVSPACVFDGASGADVLYRNASANIHNTNPQASLDLDNKFMNYGAPVPLGSGILQGGAANCGDEGRGGAGNGKSETFKQYLDGLANQYAVGGGSGNHNQATSELQNPDFVNSKTGVESTTTMPNNTSNAGSTSQFSAPPSTFGLPITTGNRVNTTKNGNLATTLTSLPSQTQSQTQSQGQGQGQQGGGFTTDPSEYIAGRPVYKAYDDCCPPAIVNNQLVMGAPDQPVCGLGAIKGGARRRSTRASRKHPSRRRKTNNRRRTIRRRSHSQRGGDFVYSATKSTPAPFADAFNGPAGVFRYPDDMTTRTFDETQPNYSVNAI